VTPVRAAIAAIGSAAALALSPAGASADTVTVTLQTAAFTPSQVTVLTGDTVAWHNSSFRDHTVTSRDGSFGSPGHIAPNSGYSYAFPSAGSFPYYCSVHPFMTGEVDVYPVLLDGPSHAVNRGTQFTLSGRAAPGTGSVDIQEDSGSGFASVAPATVDPSGSFSASLPAVSSARYRAVNAAGASPTVQVAVVDRRLVVSVSRRGHRAIIRVRAVPRDPGGRVTLQIWKRERFGWWPVSRRRLDRHSRTVFRAPLGALARVVLTLPDGWTPLVTTPARRLPHQH
jgi:plastocyanin